MRHLCLAAKILVIESTERREDNCSLTMLSVCKFLIVMLRSSREEFSASASFLQLRSFLVAQALASRVEILL